MILKKHDTTLDYFTFTLLQHGMGMAEISHIVKVWQHGMGMAEISHIVKVWQHGMGMAEISHIV